MWIVLRHILRDNAEVLRTVVSFVYRDLPLATRYAYNCTEYLATGTGKCTCNGTLCATIVASVNISRKNVPGMHTRVPGTWYSSIVLSNTRFFWIYFLTAPFIFDSFHRQLHFLLNQVAPCAALFWCPFCTIDLTGSIMQTSLQTPTRASENPSPWFEVSCRSRPAVPFSHSVDYVQHSTAADTCGTHGQAYCSPTNTSRKISEQKKSSEPCMSKRGGVVSKRMWHRTMQGNGQRSMLLIPFFIAAIQLCTQVCDGAGRAEDALFFDGKQGDFADVDPPNPGYLFVTPARVAESALPTWYEFEASFSIDAWFRSSQLFKGTSIEGGIISCLVSDVVLARYSGFGVTTSGVDLTGKLHFYATQASNQARVSADIKEGVWYHFAAIFVSRTTSNSQMRLYLNSVEVDSHTFPNPGGRRQMSCSMSHAFRIPAKRPVRSNTFDRPLDLSGQ